jgi:hypothetical protein
MASSTLAASASVGYRQLHNEGGDVLAGFVLSDLMFARATRFRIRL